MAWSSLRGPVSEATLVRTAAGLEPEGPGWFVVNVADSVAVGTDEGECGFHFEGRQRFPHFGINITVVEPGQHNGDVPRRSSSRSVPGAPWRMRFEEHERRLRRWDLVY